MNMTPEQQAEQYARDHCHAYEQRDWRRVAAADYLAGWNARGVEVSGPRKLTADETGKLLAMAGMWVNALESRRHELVKYVESLIAGSTEAESRSGPRKLTPELERAIRTYGASCDLAVPRELEIAAYESLVAAIESSTVEAADKLVKAEQDKSLAELKEIERLLRTDSSARRYVIYNYVDAAIRARTPEDTPK